MKDFSYLIGRPYASGGMGPEEFDCYGLVRHVWKEALGVNLPEKCIGWRRYGDVLDWPVEIDPYDILMFMELEENIVNHIGVAISKTDFLHAGRIFGGVVCTSVWMAKDKIKAIGRVKP